jgi:superfamily II DNA or RNA helicase
MEKIGFGRGVAEELFTEPANILSQVDDISVRDAEIEYRKLREIIGVGLKGTVADIDVLKFDYLVIDEAHTCKNVFSMVKKDKAGRKRFGMTGATSDTGIKSRTSATSPVKRNSKRWKRKRGTGL